MPATSEHSFRAKDFKIELEEHGNDLGELPGWMFEGLLFYTDRQLTNDNPLTDEDPDFRMKQACDTAKFAGARLTNELQEGVTHVLVGEDRSTTRTLRQKLSLYCPQDWESLRCASTDIGQVSTPATPCDD